MGLHELTGHARVNGTRSYERVLHVWTGPPSVDQLAKRTSRTGYAHTPVMEQYGVPLGSKVYYECDTLIILRGTLINLRATLITLRAT